MFVHAFLFCLDGRCVCVCVWVSAGAHAEVLGMSPRYSYPWANGLLTVEPKPKATILLMSYEV